METNKSDKFIYVEPNDFLSGGDKPISLEDLSIYFDLRVEYKPQKYITGSTNYGETLHFRCSIGDDNKYQGILSTLNGNWSTSSYGNYTLSRINMRGNEELLGIEEIIINYNSFMVPEVEIKFVDIKGAALHAAEELIHDENGILNQNADITTKFLSCFFTVPFPRFEMVIKGYYGQPLFYDLTCADFRSSFDSKTGNYDVVTKLVGYSFGLISDVTMSSILAAPYSTYFGAKYWEEQISDGRFKIDGKPMPTIQEIVGLWNKKYDEITKLKEEYGESQEVNNYSALQQLQGTIHSLTMGHEKVLEYIAYLKTYKKNDKCKILFDNVKKILLIFATEEYNSVTPNTWGDKDTIDGYINELQELIGAYYNNLNDLKKADFYKYDGDSKGRFKFLNDKIEDKKLDKKTYDEIKELYYDLYNNDESKDKMFVYIYDFFHIIEYLTTQIDNKKQQISKIQVGVENELNEKLENILEFRFTIENLSKICFAHLETFLYMFECVKRLEEKKSDNEKLISFTNNQNKLGIFPSCTSVVIENGVSKRQEKFIGNYLPDREEIKFVHGMFEGLKVGVTNNDTILPFHGGGRRILFDCLCPLDVFRKESPFERYNGSTLTKEFFDSRCAELFILGVTRILGDNAKEMGKIDAYNYAKEYPEGYEGIENDILSKKWEGLYKGVDVNEFVNNAKILNQTTKTLLSVDANLMLFRVVDDNSLNGCQMCSWSQNEKKITINASEGWGGEEINTCFSFANNINNCSAYIVPKALNENDVHGIEEVWYKLPNVEKENSESGNILFDYRYNGKTVVRPISDNDKLFDANHHTVLKKPEYLWTLKENGEYKSRYFIQTVACHQGMNDEKYTIIAIPGFKNGVYSLTNGTLFSQSIYRNEENIYIRALLFLLSFYWGKDCTSTNIEDLFEEGGVDDAESIQEVRYTSNDSYFDNQTNAERFCRRVGKTLLSGVTNDSLFLEVVPLFYVLKISSIIYCLEKNLISMQSHQDLYYTYGYWMKSLIENMQLYYRSYLCRFFEKWVKTTYEAWDKEFINADNTTDSALYYLSYGNFGYYDKEIGLDFFQNKISLNEYRDLVDIQHITVYRFFRQTHPIVQDMTKQLFKNVVWYKYNPNILSQNIANVYSDLFNPLLESILEKYMKGFNEGLSEKFKGKVTQQVKTELHMPSKIENELEFQLYLHYKQLWDRWICDEKNSYKKWILEDVFGEDKGRIHFIDSSYNKIGQLILANLEKFVELVQSCIEQENLLFLSFLSYFYKDNNCILFNIQNFYDNQNVENVRRIFEPISYTEINWGNIKDFSDLVVMFSYHPADSMEDSFNIDDTVDNLPEQLKTFIEGNYRVPAIGVAYGRQNQNYFMDINVSMNTPATTEQSLQAYLRIAEENSKNSASDTSSKIKSIGQDSFQVFSNHAYECNVTMMGCAWIQPLMYFQLKHVPLFRGAYIIQKVTHTITQGHMITKFGGMRVSRKAMRVLEQAHIFMQKNMIQNNYALQENLQANVLNNCSYAFFNPYGENNKSKEKYESAINNYFEQQVSYMNMNNLTLFGLIFMKTSDIYKNSESDKDKIVNRLTYVMHNNWIHFREEFEEAKAVFDKFLDKFSDILYSFDSNISEAKDYYKNYEDEIDKYAKQIKIIFQNPSANLEKTSKLNKINGVMEAYDNKDGNYYVEDSVGSLIFVSNMYGSERIYFGADVKNVDKSENLTIEDLVTSFNKTASATKTLQGIKFEIKKQVHLEYGVVKALISVANKDKQDEDILATCYDMILQTYGKEFLRSVVWVVKGESNGHEMWEYIGIELPNSTSFDVKVGFISNESDLTIETVDDYKNLHEKFYTSILSKYSYDKTKQTIDNSFKNDCKNFISLTNDNASDMGGEKTWKDKVLDFIKENNKTKGIVIKPCTEVMHEVGWYSQNLSEQTHGQFQFEGSGKKEEKLEREYNQIYVATPKESSAVSIELLMARNGLEEMPNGTQEMCEKVNCYAKYAYEHANPSSKGECAKGVRIALAEALNNFSVGGRPNSACRYINILGYWGFTKIYEGFHSQYIGSYENGDIIVTAGLNLPERDANGKLIKPTINKDGELVSENRAKRHGHIQIFYNGKWYADREFPNANAYGKEKDRPCYLFRAIDRQKKDGSNK